MPALTTITRSTAKVVGQDKGSTLTLTEAASQAFKAGDVLTVNASGLLNQTIASGSNLASGGVERGVVVSHEPASGTTGDDRRVLVPLDGVMLHLPVFHDTAASAVTAASQRGQQYQLRYHSTYGWMVDLNTAATNPVVEVAEIAPGFAVGEQYGTVVVRFLGSVVYGG